jgi:hypothetical protein
LVGSKLFMPTERRLQLVEVSVTIHVSIQGSDMRSFSTYQLK